MYLDGARSSKLVLVLDAIRVPVYVRKTVVKAFQAQYGDQAANEGYAAIWLVGPTARLTRRLS